LSIANFCLASISSKQHAHSENSKPARVHVQHPTLHIACARTIADTKAQFCTKGIRFERVDITTPRTEFGYLGADARSVAKSNLGIREKRETRIGAPYFIAIFDHGLPPAGDRRNEFEMTVYRTAIRTSEVCALARERDNWLSGQEPDDLPWCGMKAF